MRYIIFNILLLTTIGYSQTVKVAYIQEFANTNIDVSMNFNFILNDSLSIYIEENSEITEKENDLNYNQKSISLNFDKKSNNVYLSTKNDFYFIESFFGKAINIKEDKFDNNWVYIDSTKQISNYKCKLASKLFRGRKYYVWYAEDIPTLFGPWKLNGVGGLILEAFDSEKEFALYATKISFLDEQDKEIENFVNDVTLNIFKDSDESITIDQLRKMIDTKNEIILNKIRQQMPRGVTVPDINKDCKDCGTALEVY